MKHISETHETYRARCHGVMEKLDQHSATMQMWAGVLSQIGKQPGQPCNQLGALAGRPKQQRDRQHVAGAAWPRHRQHTERKE
jgi:hypothetical protein